MQLASALIGKSSSPAISIALKATRGRQVTVRNANTAAMVRVMASPFSTFLVSYR